jgi:hypothetical protein
MTKRGLNGVIKFYDKITIGLVLASVAAYVRLPPVPCVLRVAPSLT